MKIYSIILVLIALCIFACKKETTNNISGVVALYDDGNIPVNNNNMIITIEGTSPVLSAQTDTEGNFLIQDVPIGIYTLLFNKTNYGEFKYFDVTLTETGGDFNISETINLGKVSELLVSNFTVLNTHGEIMLKGAIDPSGAVDDPKYVRIFYNTNQNVDSYNYSYYSKPYPVTGDTFEFPLAGGELIDEGFAPGSTVYLKIYGDSYWDNSYKDPVSGKMVFPNLSINSPDSISLVVPQIVAK